MNAQPVRYARSLVILHGVMAIMILAMLFAGHFITAATPNSSPEKIGHLKGHMMMGMAVGVLLIVRWIVRWRTAKPAPATSGMAWADRLAGLTHLGFYVLILVQVASGFTTSVMANLPDIVFNGHGMLPPTFDSAARSVHGLIAGVLSALVILHVIGALYHQFVLKDGLFSRMRLRGPR